jgi:hypothetical protein
VGRKCGEVPLNADRNCGRVAGGNVFVVGSSVAEAAVEDADETVTEGAERLVVQVAGVASLVVETPEHRDWTRARRTPIGRWRTY